MFALQLKKSSLSPFTRKTCTLTTRPTPSNPMQEAKDTARALVRLGYDGRVHKTFRGPMAKERFENEVRVLQFLAERECPFVPRMLEKDPETLHLVTTNCGQRVERISEPKLRQLFLSLEQYGVRHDDPFVRNVTYRMQDGRFCLIDFEFATILVPGYPPPPPIDPKNPPTPPPADE